MPNHSLATLPVIPAEVEAFAANKGANGHLNAVIDLARPSPPRRCACL